MKHFVERKLGLVMVFLSLLAGGCHFSSTRETLPVNRKKKVWEKLTVGKKYHAARIWIDSSLLLVANASSLQLSIGDRGQISADSIWGKVYGDMREVSPFWEINLSNGSNLIGAHPAIFVIEDYRDSVQSVCVLRGTVCLVKGGDSAWMHAVDSGQEVIMGMGIVKRMPIENMMSLVAWIPRNLIK